MAHSNEFTWAVDTEAAMLVEISPTAVTKNKDLSIGSRSRKPIFTASTPSSLLTVHARTTKVTHNGSSTKPNLRVHQAAALFSPATSSASHPGSLIGLQELWFDETEEFWTETVAADSKDLERAQELLRDTMKRHDSAVEIGGGETVEGGAQGGADWEFVKATEMDEKVEVPRC